jgi:hypothetical protein
MNLSAESPKIWIVDIAPVPFDVMTAANVLIDV